MAAPRPGSEAHRPSFDDDPVTPSPRTPQPLPDRERRLSTPSIVMVLAVLIVVALVVLL